MEIEIVKITLRSERYLPSTHKKRVTVMNAGFRGETSKVYFFVTIECIEFVEHSFEKGIEE